MIRVTVCYVTTSIQIPIYQPMARRFAQTYQENPPGSYPHELYVLVNGQKYPELDRIFNGLGVKYLQHNNVGKDCGAYQMAAEKIPCDLMLCLGAQINFHKPGWLDWIVKIYLEEGPGLYGSWGCHQPLPHIRTTGFFCPPDLLNAYPHYVTDSQRYPFEHGPESLTLFSKRLGYGTWQITWRGVFQMEQWHVPTRDDCLFLDQNTARMGYG